jgi:lipoate-protein ligase B
MTEGGPTALTAWTWLGRQPFEPMAALQERLRERILAGAAPETLLFCEHHPVITLGRRARPEHLLLSEAELTARGIQICQASRGGEVTYHGPGQLVCYPIVRLRRGVLAHVEGMAEAVIALLARFGIAGEWRRTLPGVWVGAEKICAFGVQVRRGVSVHGLALNVSTDLRAFSTIVPCGLPGARVTSVAQLRGPVAPPLAELAGDLARLLARAFRLELAPGPAASSDFWPSPGEPPSQVIHSPAAPATSPAKT